MSTNTNIIDYNLVLSTGANLIATSNTNTIGSIVTTGGNVGISITNPISKLHISNGELIIDPSGSSNTAGRMRFTSKFGTNYIQSGLVGNNTAGQLQIGPLYGVGSSWVTILNNGFIGIATTNPSYRLHVTGDIYATGDITAYSDARLKSNIETISNPIDKVNKLRGVYYTHTETQKQSIGLIAQETIDILPEVVATKGEYLGINYGNITALLIESTKELNQQIKQLNQKINEQEEKINEQNEKINNLNNVIKDLK